MDDSIIQAIMQKKGAANVPENVNRIREFAASNPDVLERFAMGSGGQFEDNSGLLQLIDQQIAQTNGAAPAQVDQVGNLIDANILPSVQNANGASRKSALA